MFKSFGLSIALVKNYVVLIKWKPNLGVPLDLEAEEQQEKRQWQYMDQCKILLTIPSGQWNGFWEDDRYCLHLAFATLALTSSRHPPVYFISHSHTSQCWAGPWSIVAHHYSYSSGASGQGNPLPPLRNIPETLSLDMGTRPAGSPDFLTLKQGKISGSHTN